MGLSSSDIASTIYDPMKIQKTVIELIENDGGITITDATSPFVMALEAAATTSSASAMEARSIIRKKFPNLALTPEELYQHVADDELANMFAVPATTNMIFQIPVIDLFQSGYRPEGDLYSEMTIPIGTKITIMNNTVLTLLNDIVIRLYKDNSIFIEQQSNDNDMAINDIGILNATIYHDENQIAWITFLTKVKQVTINTYNTTVTSDTGLIKVVNIDTSYCYAEVKYANAKTNNKYERIKVTHNDEYIDPLLPTAYVSVANKDITIKIPDIYTGNGSISGNVKIDIYHTEGSIYLPINKYQAEDFILELGDTTSTLSAAVSKNIPILAMGSDVLSGGANSMSFEDLRTSIINNTTGDIDLPITDLQIKRSGNMDGYFIFKSKDIITDRTYVATRNLPPLSSILIKTKQDVFFNTSKIVLEDIKFLDNVTINEDNFVIKSGSLFKVNNSIVTMVNNDERNYIFSLTDLEKIDYLKSNKLYYTPFHYVINTEDGYTNTRIYSLDYPSLSGFRIMAQNTAVPQNANTAAYAIVKTSTGYRIITRLKTDTNFDALDKNYVNVQLSIPLKGNEVNVYFNGVYDNILNTFTFDIETDLFVDEEGYIDVKNGMSTIFTKRISIDTIGTFRIFTTDTNIIDETHFLINEVYRNDMLLSHTVFGKENINIEFGKEIKNMWNRVYNTYTERKYKTYSFDEVLRYEKDVYDVFNNGSIFREEIIDGVLSLVKNKIASAGDIILDSDGTPLYKHKVGDIIRDEDNKPIIDIYSGIVRYIDFIMLEYEFAVANTSPHKEYLGLTIDNLYRYIFTDVPYLNNKMLENTNLVYKTLKSCLPVTVSNNTLTYTVPYLVKPAIILYMTLTAKPTSDDLSKYRDTIGAIIDKYLELDIIKLEDIRAEIKKAIGSNVYSVKVTGLDSNNSEVISTDPVSNKLALSKVLELTPSGELEVRYDIDIDVENI